MEQAEEKRKEEEHWRKDRETTENLDESQNLSSSMLQAMTINSNFDHEIQQPYLTAKEREREEYIQNILTSPNRSIHRLKLLASLSSPFTPKNLNTLGYIGGDERNGDNNNYEY